MLTGKCLWPGSFPGAKTPAPPSYPSGSVLRGLHDCRADWARKLQGYSSLSQGGRRADGYQAEPRAGRVGGHVPAGGLLWDLGQPPGSPGDRRQCSSHPGGSSERGLDRQRSRSGK